VVDAVAFSPDGRRLVSGGDDRLVLVWDVKQGGEPLMTLQGHASFLKAVSYAPDGKTIASAGLDQQIILWDAVTGTQIRTLAGQEGMIFCLDWSRDGRRLASGGDSLLIWDAASGEILKNIRSFYGFVNGLAFSPDGKHLSTAQYNKAVLLFDRLP
jgi:WD40 repeat protein